MKILITGSSGMLGTELCGVLKTGHDIAGIDIVDPPAAGPRPQRFYEASITDRGQIEGIFGKEKPDLVIHTAAWTDVDACEKEPEKAYEVNTAGTRNIAEASSKEDVPVMFISTDFVFDGKKKTPYVESDVARPINAYGMTKWEAEKVLEHVLARYVIVRTSWLYGKNGNNFVDTVIAKGKIEKRLRIVRDQVGSPTYAKDFACALKELIGSLGEFGRCIFHVSNSGWCSRYDFALKILDEAKMAEKIVVEPILSAGLTEVAPRPEFSALDSSEFQKVTEHQMRSWEKALADYVKERCL